MSSVKQKRPLGLRIDAGHLGLQNSQIKSLVEASIRLRDLEGLGLSGFVSPWRWVKALNPGKQHLCMTKP